MYEILLHVLFLIILDSLHVFYMYEMYKNVLHVLLHVWDIMLEKQLS